LAAYTRSFLKHLFNRTGNLAERLGKKAFSISGKALTCAGLLDQNL
jgi:hypothetical protein